MRVVEQTPDRLVLRQPPTVTYWVAAALFVVGVIALAVAAAAGLAVGEPVGLVVVVSGGLLVLVGALAALFAATITVTLDRATDSVRIERQGWFGRSEQAEALSVVEDAVVESTTDSEGGTLYRAALRLAGGRTLPLTWGYDNFEESKRATVETIRHFLGRGPAGRP
jgi:hypothetical protein